MREQRALRTGFLLLDPDLAARVQRNDPASEHHNRLQSNQPGTVPRRVAAPITGGTSSLNPACKTANELTNTDCIRQAASKHIMCVSTLQ